MTNTTVPREGKQTAAASPQKFVICHAREEDFKEGMRNYALYRDLGVSAATNGTFGAHVIRLVPPCTDEVRKLHRHHLDFQMIYVLKGWLRMVIDGQGEHIARAGTAWIQPPGIEHAVLDYSDDCEMIEIVAPAKFETTTSV